MRKQMLKDSSIHIIALAALGGGLSGGDRIFIELARYLSKNSLVNVYVWEEGLEMCKREGLKGKNLKIRLIKVGWFSKLGFLFIYLYRILLGIKLGLTLHINHGDCIYSASEFWMDSLPATILKLRYRNCRWIAAWLQTAPNPWIGFTEGKREKLYRLRSFMYWFIQKLIKPIVARFANYILINNTLEKKQFPILAKKDKLRVIGGAVNVLAVNEYTKKQKPPKIKKYLAVYQGRFHPQKGIVELIEIWKLVILKNPNAKLALIGDGPLMNEVKKKIQKLSLTRNIDLFGYLHDGHKKYSIFNNSSLVVHTSFYDSGGMASAEAMAFGLPCVAFDLKAFNSYYPKGLIKVPVGNLQAFADAISGYNNNPSLYNKIGSEAKNTIRKYYSWQNRLDKIELLFQHEK